MNSYFIYATSTSWLNIFSPMEYFLLSASHPYGCGRAVGCGLLQPSQTASNHDGFVRREVWKQYCRVCVLSRVGGCVIIGDFCMCVCLSVCVGKAGAVKCVCLNLGVSLSIYPSTSLCLSIHLRHPSLLPTFSLQDGSMHETPTVHHASPTAATASATAAAASGGRGETLPLSVSVLSGCALL